MQQGIMFAQAFCFAADYFVVLQVHWCSNYYTGIKNAACLSLINKLEVINQLLMSTSPLQWDKAPSCYHQLC